MSNFTLNQIQSLLKNPNSTQDLCNQARIIREKYCQNEVFIRGLVEFSNYCINDCFYCGLRKDNNNLIRYRLSFDEIKAVAQRIIDKGIETIVLQSGDDFFYKCEDICTLIKEIKKDASHIAITLSLGERSIDEYKAFYDSGADRYLLKHETQNEALYKQLHPDQSLKNRINILRNLRKIGFQIGSGHIVGLPNQTPADLAEDILFYQDFQPDMIGIGPFIAQSNTPLSKNPSPNIDLVLRSLALTRIVTKNAHMPVTTAFFTLGQEDDHIRALTSACNVIMIDFTPKKYAQNYKIYDNKYRIDFEKMSQIIKKARCVINFKRGDSFK